MRVLASTLISNKNVLEVEYVNAYTITSINTDAFHPNRELLIRGAVDTKAQAQLETSAAAGGLIKTFDDYERSGL
jgi:hypothetical protein